MSCIYFKNGLCQLATEIAGYEAATTEQACAVCGSLNPPNDLNNVVVSIAINACEDDKDKVAELLNKYNHLLKVPHGHASPQKDLLDSIRNGTGVGSQLFKLLEELGIQHTTTCKCIILADKMNKWGPAGCRLSKKEIVTDMRENAKAYRWSILPVAAINAFKIGLAWNLDLADIYGSLVDEAIRRAIEVSK